MAVGAAADEFDGPLPQPPTDTVSDCDRPPDVWHTLADGLLVQRSCTDIVCLGVLVITWLVFLTVSFRGATGDVNAGAPERLYAPRDFRGDYCGLRQHGGADFSSQAFLSRMLNASGAVDRIAREAVCSTAAGAALRGVLDAPALERYACACCKIPCGSCLKAPAFADYPTEDALAAAMDRRRAELTDPARASSVFSTSGAFGGAIAGLFHDLDTFFVPVCTRTCGSSAFNGTGMRSFLYAPPADAPWREAWDVLSKDQRLSGSTAQAVVRASFAFSALPESECGYEAKYCVPFPGIGFAEGYGSYCRFQVPSSVAEEMDGVVDSVGFDGLQRHAAESVGTAAGDVLETLDCLAIVAVASVAYGFVCVVLLRFIIRPAIWASLFCVLGLLVAGGAVMYVASDRCSDDSFVESGRSHATALDPRGAWEFISRDAAAEELSGRGEDYRGYQTRTRSGRTCQSWEAQSPQHHNTTAALLPDAGLKENFCRNPTGAPTIWCYTTDPGTRWEFCDRLGSSPWESECLNGYAVKDEGVRKIMKGVSVAAFSLAGLWAILVVCLRGKLRAAIAINEVAAHFVFETPFILLVPFVQTAVMLMWTVFWLYCVASLLSQIPPGHVPGGAFTWAEAFGAGGAPGVCSEAWPRGFAWRYLGDEGSESDPCTGRFGNTSAIVPRCWRCAPPRYSVDARVVASVFAILWTNELLVAIGICIVAGACGFWYFRSTVRRPQWGSGREAVLTSTFNTLRYHVGTLATGSLVIASAQMARLCLTYIDGQARLHKNKVTATIMRVLQCCMWCLETCLKFVSKHAYIQTALVGTPFFESARVAFQLAIKNPVRFVLLGAFGNVVRLIGTAFVVVATVFTGFLVLQALAPAISPVAPLVGFGCLAFLVARAFLNVFGLAVDSMLQCFVMSEQMGLPPDRVPKPLQHLLKTRGVKLAASSKTSHGGAAPDGGGERTSSAEQQR